jgi:hypothetical protein
MPVQTYFQPGSTPALLNVPTGGLFNYNCQLGKWYEVSVKLTVDADGRPLFDAEKCNAENVIRYRKQLIANRMMLNVADKNGRMLGNIDMQSKMFIPLEGGSQIRDEEMTTGSCAPTPEVTPGTTVEAKTDTKEPANK